MSTVPVTLKPRPADVPKDAGVRGDYLYGEDQAEYLRPDWLLVTVEEHVRAANEPLQGIALRRLSSSTWGVLEELLPQGLEEVQRMRGNAAYEDVYTQHTTTSLYPLLIVTPDAQQYPDVNNQLEFATLDTTELLEYLPQLVDKKTHDCGVALGRIEQVLLGSGYTQMCLPSDGSACIELQFAEFTNGDILVLAGFEWFNK